MKRFRRWRTGRPFHTVYVLDDQTGARIDKIRFRDDEWSLLLLSMGALGCRTPQQAVLQAFQLSVQYAQAELEPKQPLPVTPKAEEVHTGQYL